MTKLLVAAAILLGVTSNVRADAYNIAEDDASQSAYSGGWSDGSNGGSGFAKWTFTMEGNDSERHSGFFIAEKKNNSDLQAIARNDKAFGMFANGSGFEEAVAYRSFDSPLAAGDTFSFMLQAGRFEKKFEKDDPSPASIGLVLRNGHASSSTSDYNAGARFEFGYYQGKGNYQIYDGSDTTDSGISFVPAGVSVSVTLTGTDSYDLEVQTMNDKKVIKLPRRKLRGSGSIDSFALFDRNGERYDAYFNQFQVAREVK